ncbi:MAG TPA: DNA repair protein RadC [Bacteroidota bacterium]|nr:DNA repair protein RadC [Bacteroidota bacterium]
MRRRRKSDARPGRSLARVGAGGVLLGERPRDKLFRYGPATLSDAEVLALLVRSGNGRRSALDLALGVLERDRSLRRTARRNVRELMRVKGIGEANAAGILAAFELGRRVQAEAAVHPRPIRSPEDVARLMVPRLRDLMQEVFYVLILDANNALRAEIEISRGTLNASVVHPREVFKVAIDHVAASVIVVHNHPSGNPEPSREDVEITRQLAEAGKIVGIPLHDHLIVAGEGYTSLAQRGDVFLH